MVVRDYLASLPRTEELLIICPSLELKDKWIDRLRVRHIASGLNKDYRAYMNAVDRYSENIQELMYQEGFEKLIIKNMNYDLVDMIKEYKKRRKLIDKLSRIITDLENGYSGYMHLYDELC